MWQCWTEVVLLVLGVWAQYMQVLHGGWTLFEGTTTFNTYRKVLLGSAWILCKVMSSSVKVMLYGLSTSEAGFASGTCNRLYEPD